MIKPKSIEDSDIRVDADDLIALRGRAERLKPARAMPARSALAGAHRSRFRGRGMDYRESRHYQAGDDIRNMDWRITARAGHAHVKVFDEERERPVVIIADFGPSMFFASGGALKSVVAARLAALIGWAAIGHGDRIGALIFDRGGHQELQPTGGRRGQMRLIRALVEAGDPERGLSQDRQSTASHADLDGGHLTHALSRLRRVARPGSLVFLLSDFYTLDDDSERHLTRLARHNDLTAFQILDPLEVEPPPPGRYGISDGRRNGFIDIGVRAERERYKRHFAQHHARVQAVTARNGIRLLRCTTFDDPAERLAAAMAAPGRGMRVDTGADIGAGIGVNLGAKAGVDRGARGRSEAP
jgi:uncharacterized protein (DUF58 family)